MVSKPLTLGLVAAGCMAAAGLGAYVAVRQGSGGVSGQPAAAVENANARPPASADAPGPVAETEAVVTEPAPAPEEAPAPEPEVQTPVAPSRRKVAAARPPAEPAASPVSRTARGLDRPWPTRGVEPPAIPVESGAPDGVGEPVPLEPYDPPPVFEDLVVSAGSVLGLLLNSTVSTETARVEDPIEARVTRDVFVGGMVAIPAGTRAYGTVTLVDPGGKVKEQARLGVRFHTLVLADMTRVPIQSDTIFREGEPPSKESVAKIGGAAAAGAVLGAIFGGAKGAAIGGAAGAAGGTTAVMAGGRNPATLAAGTTVTVRLISPVTVTVER